jgi:hypothetical protein
MGFLTPALLAGAALIVVPIALHLVMRREPRPLKFPALRFVKNRQAANRRKLNFRHLLLLALRCALLAGLALALARPTLNGSGPAGAPVGMAVVIDNALPMQYVHDNQTRQAEATATTLGLLRQLPEGAAGAEGTQIAIVDRSRSGAGFVADRGTAESRLRNLRPESKPRPLEEAVCEAIALVAERAGASVFLLSDLNAAAWNPAAIEAIHASLTAAPDVRLYLVDVGVPEIHNLALGTLELSPPVLRPGEPLRLTVPLEGVGISEDPLLELYLVDGDQPPVKRGQQIVQLQPGKASEATFELGDLPLGTHQGYVQLAASDPWLVDNTRYFSVEVRPPAKVLLLGQTDRDTLFLREALSPSAGPSAVRFECTTGRYDQAAQQTLSDYAAVCLLDPPPLTDALWQALANYASAGGGVGIFLGERAQAAPFNTGTATALLPGTLLRKSRQATYFRPQRFDHPALVALRPYAESIPWQASPVFRTWQFGPLAEGTYVVARFANRDPALMVRPLGQGRVLTLATTISDPPQLAGRDPWNLLPMSAWPFVPLVNQWVGYLAHSDNRALLYSPGETVRLHLAPNQRVSSFVLHPPSGQSLRRSLPPGEETIPISTTRELGNYRVASGGPAGALKRGFSINVPAEVSRLERVDLSVLEEGLPAAQVRRATSLEAVERQADLGRSGQELFPWLIWLVLLIWAGEYWLANRFYRGAAG